MKRTEQNRTEQNKIEQNRTKQNTQTDLKECRHIIFKRGKLRRKVHHFFGLKKGKPFWEYLIGSL